MATNTQSPVTEFDLEGVSPRFHGSLCDEIAKLGQFDILTASFMEFIWDGCGFTDEFKELLCDRDCNSTTTTTECIFGETTSTTTCGDVPDVTVGFAIVSCTANGADSFLTWTGDAEATYWEIHRSVDGGGYSLYDTQEGENAYLDTDSPGGFSYSYKIKACNECGCSEFSATILTCDKT